MYSGRVRLSAVVLALSAVVLVASVSEVQALERHWAFCRSGRCVRATGTYMMFDRGRLMASSPCVLMLDLVYRYIAGDHPNFPPGGGWLPVIIEYGWFSIHAYTGDIVPLELHIRVGIPGGAIMRVHPYDTPYGFELLFVGFASFYYKMEYVPWL